MKFHITKMRFFKWVMLHISWKKLHKSHVLLYRLISSLIIEKLTVLPVLLLLTTSVITFCMCSVKMKNKAGKLQRIIIISPCMKYSKVLIIDDDIDDVEILADAFTQSGVDGVHYEHSAMHAFMYLEQCRAKDEMPKLIVTDLYLPGITGAEFLKDLKQMEMYKHIHVIVLSSVKSEQEIEKYKQMGAEDYLQKPSSYTEYLAIARLMKEKAKL